MITEETPVTLSTALESSEIADILLTIQMIFMVANRQGHKQWRH